MRSLLAASINESLDPSPSRKDHRQTSIEILCTGLDSGHSIAVCCIVNPSIVMLAQLRSKKEKKGS